MSQRVLVDLLKVAVPEIFVNLVPSLPHMITNPPNSV
jgi:hypothetical protein